MATMFIQGKCLGSERKQGSGDNADGTKYSYDYMLYHVLTGLEVLACRLSETFGAPPADGEEFAAEVDVQASAGRRGGVLRPTLSKRVELHVKQIAPRLAATGS